MFLYLYSHRPVLLSSLEIFLMSVLLVITCRVEKKANNLVPVRALFIYQASFQVLDGIQTHRSKRFIVNDCNLSNAGTPGPLLRYKSTLCLFILIFITFKENEINITFWSMQGGGEAPYLALYFLFIF